MWFLTSERLPKEGVFVETMIADEKGIRNKTNLKYDSGLWFLPDGMYVYYQPTHWRYI